ncbi:DUF2927 domain-containing protein [Aliiroseovarius sp. YM-037]|uniref:DUF2927 domain-containing protein n=1 Tax=Aliiroseovarius sp. YM-037 TaxID=3341728 RepID=UPI003A8046DD
MRRVALLIPLVVLVACAPGRAPERTSRAPAATQPLPPMKLFAPRRAAPTNRTNAEIARDFLDLSFQMESGRPLDRMSRFEGAITLRVIGRAPPSMGPDLGRLLSRLRNEAGIEIAQVSGDEPANITIEAMPQAQLQRLVPKAACFVVPRVSSWSDFRRNRRGRTTDWTTLTTREQVAVFVPNDVSPQEVRDCLHEELAQALGPLNDLYRLPDSVFNDDNFHTVLTGFDMLMLRAYYAPEMRSGMTRAQAAAVLPGVLARLNPRGLRQPRRAFASTPRAWINAIETSLGPRTGNTRRRNAAREAVDIARARGWEDNRLAFALFSFARLTANQNPEASLAAFAEANAIYAASPDTQLHAAHVATHLAVFALSAGRLDTALALIDRSVPAVERAENAALLSTLLMIRAETLEQMGRRTEAQATRLDSLGWARYGFGADDTVRARLREIAALAPRPPRFGG